MILAFDTSTELTSVAVTDGATVVAQRSVLDARRHAEVLAPLLREVLAEAGVGADAVSTIACGVGPGPYTGLRVGIATARAVGLAWNRPVVGVCSLDAIAAAAFDHSDTEVVGVASDARRREVYWARYSRLSGREAGPLVSGAALIDPSYRGGSWAGRGAALYAEAFGTVIVDESPDVALLYPTAAWIARLAGELLAGGEVLAAARVHLEGQGDEGRGTADALRGARLLAPEPLYLRRPDAVESAARATP